MAHRIIFPQQGLVALEDFTPRPPGSDEIVVRTLASIISIGTETTVLHHKYTDDTHFARMFSFPQVQTGNQSVGVVEQCGDCVTHLKRGDRVFIRKAHASHWTLAAVACTPIPIGIETASAVWCGFAKIAFRAVEAAPFRVGGNTLIIGAGPIGQMAARWALAAGMKNVVLCDLSKSRLALAPPGVKTLHGPIEQHRNGVCDLCTSEGFESVIDSTGNPAVFQSALSLVAPLGRVVLLGDTGFPSQQCLSSDMMVKSVSVIAAHENVDSGAWTQSRIDALFFELTARGAFDVSGLVTNVFYPEQHVQAYELASERRDEAVGVLFIWSKA